MPQYRPVGIAVQPDSTDEGYPPPDDPEALGQPEDDGGLAEQYARYARLAAGVQDARQRLNPPRERDPEMPALPPEDQGRDYLGRPIGQPVDPRAYAQMLGRLEQQGVGQGDLLGSMARGYPGRFYDPQSDRAQRHPEERALQGYPPGTHLDASGRPVNAAGFLVTSDAEQEAKRRAWFQGLGQQQAAAWQRTQGAPGGGTAPGGWGPDGGQAGGPYGLYGGKVNPLHPEDQRRLGELETQQRQLQQSDILSDDQRRQALVQVAQQIGQIDPTGVYRNGGTNQKTKVQQAMEQLMHVDPSTGIIHYLNPKTGELSMEDPHQQERQAKKEGKAVPQSFDELSYDKKHALVEAAMEKFGYDHAQAVQHVRGIHGALNETMDTHETRDAFPEVVKYLRGESPLNDQQTAHLAKRLHTDQVWNLTDIISGKTPETPEVRARAKRIMDLRTGQQSGATPTTGPTAPKTLKQQHDEAAALEAKHKQVSALETHDDTLQAQARTAAERTLKQPTGSNAPPPTAEELHAEAQKHYKLSGGRGEYGRRYSEVAAERATPQGQWAQTLNGLQLKTSTPRWGGTAEKDDAEGKLHVQHLMDITKKYPTNIWDASNNEREQFWQALQYLHKHDSTLQQPSRGDLGLPPQREGR